MTFVSDACVDVNGLSMSTGLHLGVPHSYLLFNLLNTTGIMPTKATFYSGPEKYGVFKQFIFIDIL